MKRNKGITLIALIITIVILIILTAVTINNVMSSDLFGLAKGAAENYVKAGQEEEKTIDKMVGIMQGWQVGDDSKIQPGDVVKITERDNYTDVDGRTSTVPAGFKVSTKSSEQRIKDGLVIQDEQGNEFVWVPCYVDTKPAETAEDVQKYENHIYNQEDANTNDEAEEYGKASVEKYGGFYIGRYEAGWEDTTIQIASGNYDYFKDFESENNKKSDVTKKPVSKANTFSWNCISQQNAKQVSEKMYENVTYNENFKYTDSVDSKLVDGIAWDTTIRWIESSGIDIMSSTSYGNYVNTNKKYTGLYANHIWTYAEDIMLRTLAICY